MNQRYLYLSSCLAGLLLTSCSRDPSETTSPQSQGPSDESSSLSFTDPPGANGLNKTPTPPPAAAKRQSDQREVIQAEIDALKGALEKFKTILEQMKAAKAKRMAARPTSPLTAYWDQAVGLTKEEQKKVRLLLAELGFDPYEVISTLSSDERLAKLRKIKEVNDRLATQPRDKFVTAALNHINGYMRNRINEAYIYWLNDELASVNKQIVALEEAIQQRIKEDGILKFTESWWAPNPDYKNDPIGLMKRAMLGGINVLFTDSQSPFGRSANNFTQGAIQSAAAFLAGTLSDRSKAAFDEFVNQIASSIPDYCAEMVKDGKFDTLAACYSYAYGGMLVPWDLAAGLTGEQYTKDYLTGEVRTINDQQLIIQAMQFQLPVGLLGRLVVLTRIEALATKMAAKGGSQASRWQAIAGVSRQTLARAPEALRKAAESFLRFSTIGIAEEGLEEASEQALNGGESGAVTVKSVISNVTGTAP